MQLGIKSNPAENIAKKAGLNVVMDRCPVIEINRLRKIDFLSSDLNKERQISHNQSYTSLPKNNQESLSIC